MVKNYDLGKRIDNLAKKITDPESEKIIHIDFESFSEAEKTLFRKTNEIVEEFLKTGNGDIPIEDMELIVKSLETKLRRITELYCYFAKKFLTLNESKEIADYFFNLHFYNFDADLTEIMAFVHTWTNEEKEEFLSFLKKNGAKIPRIRRKYSELNCQEVSTDQDSEELNNTNAQNQEMEGG